MDKKELKSLEDKTRAIVDTLSSLEAETARQKTMGNALEQSKNAILKLADELATTAANLSGAIDLLQHSTLANDIDSFNLKIADVKGLSSKMNDDVQRTEELCRTTIELASKAEASIQTVDERIREIENTCSELLRRIESSDEALEQRFSELESIIGRIDRNTQKGFGKEHG